MKHKIKQMITKLTPWSVDDGFSQEKYTNKKNATFFLYFGRKKIGILEHKKNKWFFKYSDKYLENQFVLPLMDFPDINKIYEFDELPPFFAARIPNLNQPFHIKKLSKHNGNKNDIVSLLEVFGQKSINNPFELTVEAN